MNCQSNSGPGAGPAEFRPSPRVTAPYDWSQNSGRQHGWLLVEGTGAHRSDQLPSAELLVAAVRGRPVDHPLAGYARELAELHNRQISARPEQQSEIDGARRTVMRAITVWLEHQIPQHRENAALHTETLGSIIDRFAAGCVRADHLLADLGDDPGDPRIHAAWFHLAELSNGYDDLVLDVAAGRRRLPISPEQP